MNCNVEETFQIHEQQQDKCKTYREKCPDIQKKLCQLSKKVFSKDLVLKRLPIAKWLPKYKLNYLLQDMVAGITVGLTAIPQSIAYAVIAGLQTQYGLYSAFAGGFTYTIFGSCKDTSIGPTAIMSFMIQNYTGESIDFAILSTFLCGIIVLLCGLLNLGFLVQFISLSVTAGFTSAAAITIASGQIKSILGISDNSNEFISIWRNIFLKIHQTMLWDTVLGVLTIMGLIACKKLKDMDGPFPRFRNYVSLLRNALAVFFGIALAYTFSVYGPIPFAVTGHVDAQLPPVDLPPFSTIIRNGTEIGLGEMARKLGSTLVAIPLVAILESIAIAKSFSKGKIIDATQEMIALGACNVVGSFFSSMPVAGSFSRTAINNASGVQTQLGGVFTGLLVLLSILFLSNIFQFIPKATLGAILIAAMLSTVEFEKAIEIWRIRRIDVLPYLTTLFGSLLLGLEYGIGIGVCTNIALIMYNTARPKTSIDSVKIFNNDILVIVPDESIIYAGAENLKARILKHVTEQSEKKYSVVVIDGSHVRMIDFTAAKNLHAIVQDFELLKIDLVFWNWREQPTGVAYRMDEQFGRLFMKADSIEEIHLNVKNTKGVCIIEHL